MFCCCLNPQLSKEPRSWVGQHSALWRRDCDSIVICCNSQLREKTCALCAELQLSHQLHPGAIGDKVRTTQLERHGCLQMVLTWWISNSLCHGNSGYYGYSMSITYHLVSTLYALSHLIHNKSIRKVVLSLSPFHWWGSEVSRCMDFLKSHWPEGYLNSWCQSLTLLPVYSAGSARKCLLLKPRSFECWRST